MVIKVHFDMTLNFDLEDHLCILFLVVDYVVVHIKRIPLRPSYCEIYNSNLSTFLLFCPTFDLRGGSSSSHFVQIVNCACKHVSTVFQI